MRRLILIVWLACLASEAFAAEPPRPVPGVRYIYLIRHGDYDRDEQVDDRVGNGLNALGREQARWVGRRLARLPVRMTSLVSSDFTRARETADIMGHELGMTPARDSLLRECTPSSDHPATRDIAVEEEPACDSTLAAAWARYARPSPGADARDVLVCHGNVTRWFVCRALGVDLRRWRAMDIGNASITVIAVRSDSTSRLVMFSDVGHLPVAKQSWTGRGAGWGSKPSGGMRTRP